jgi:hemerythrin
MADPPHPWRFRIEPASSAMPPVGTTLFRWRDAWCVGVPAMDRDHQGLAKLLGALAGHCGEPGGAAVVPPPSRPRLLHRLALLVDETRDHFAREEALMRAADDPDYAEHRAEHGLLRAELTDLVREITARGDQRLDPETFGALKAWFLGHILDTDRRMARHLIETGFAHHH